MINVLNKQAKLTFSGRHKTYTYYDSYTFKQHEILMDMKIYLGYVVLELSKLLMYESYYDEVQPYFRLENLQMLYMDLDSFELSIRTENIIIDS